MESFFDSLKTEHVYREQYEDLRNAKAKIFQWIEVFYNRERIHSSLGYLSPACFEAESLAKAA
jgi:putative transposase